MKKYSNLSSSGIDCWTHGKHYVKFDIDNNKFKWADSKGGFVLNSSDELYSDELNKLLVCTYRTMCDMLSDENAFIDTPEDILMYAEQKLRALIEENDN